MTTSSAKQLKDLKADHKAQRPLGRGMVLGECASLNSRGELVPVKSVWKEYATWDHDINGDKCYHVVYLDNGALWDTDLERGLPVKRERVNCVSARLGTDARTGHHKVTYTFEVTCPWTGEVLTHEDVHVPRAKRGPKDKKRTAMDDQRILAPCDPMWRQVYGLRNECESWFSWLKAQFPQHQRAASLDLNHQFLDVLHAAALTNSITRYNYRLGRHLSPPSIAAA